MKQTTHALLAIVSTAGLANAATVLEVNFSNIVSQTGGITRNLGDSVFDGDRIEDRSGNGYHGFFGGASGETTASVVTTPTGRGIDNTATGDSGYGFIRDNLPNIPDAWDGGTTTTTPYFTLDGSATGSWTMEAVVNWNNTSSSTNGIMGQTGGNQIWIRENGGKIEYVIGAGDAIGSFNTIDVSSAKTDGNFHGLALVYDGAAGEVRTYFDGALVHTNTDSDIGSLGSLLSGTSDFRLGNYNGSSSYDFNGIMDQFRISDTALTPAEFLAVPELSSFTLLGLGGLALALRRRK